MRPKQTRSGPSWEKKQKHCDPLAASDKDKGSQWDHTVMDVPSRFVVTLVVGRRDGETLKEAVADFADRTGGAPPALLTTDDCSTYPQVILDQYGESAEEPPIGPAGGRQVPQKQWVQGAVYATVNKTYGKGEVTSVRRKLVYGTEEELARALAESPCSTEVNTAFVERQNGTDRTYNARKARKTYEFSKLLLFHVAVTWWVMFCYNFHHLHRGLAQHLSDGTHLRRTPAMALGLTEQPLTVAQILTTQVVGFVPSRTATAADFRRRPRNGGAP